MPTHGSHPHHAVKVPDVRVPFDDVLFVGPVLVWSHVANALSCLGETAERVLLACLGIPPIQPTIPLIFFAKHRVHALLLIKSYRLKCFYSRSVETDDADGYIGTGHGWDNKEPNKGDCEYTRRKRKRKDTK